jgi:hypothetical protein
MQISKVLMALAAATLFVTGCSQQKTSATKALDAIETSLAEVKDDAAKYAPDGLKGVESQLASLNESLEKKDYENVLAGAPQLEKAVGSLKSAVASGKEHAREALAVAKGEWENLNVEVPKMVDNIQTRVNELSKDKIHIRVTKDELASAKTGLEWMKTEWAHAVNESSSGATTKAAEMAKAIKAKGEEVQKTLGMKEA